MATSGSAQRMSHCAATPRVNLVGLSGLARACSATDSSVQTISFVHRFQLNVPDGPKEAPVDRTLALVEAAGTEAINHFVAIKQQVTSTQAALEQMAEHLRGLPTQGQSAREVLQVAAFQISEHPAASVTHMNSVFGKCTDAVHEATQTIKAARSGVSAALDWVSVCNTQWGIAQTAITQVTKLIGICISVIAQGQLDEEVLMSLATSMSSLEAAFSTGGDAVDESLQELETELLIHRKATDASGDIVIGEVFHECNMFHECFSDDYDNFSIGNGLCSHDHNLKLSA